LAPSVFLIYPKFEVSLPPKQISAGIIPLKTNFSGVSDPGEQLLNLNVSANGKPNSKIIQRFILGLFTKKQRPKISCYLSFKTSQNQKKPCGKKYLISSYSMAKNMPKIAEVKLSSCGLEVVNFRKIADCGIAEL
jgi:hypothetical protein